MSVTWYEQNRDVSPKTFLFCFVVERNSFLDPVTLTFLARDIQEHFQESFGAHHSVVLHVWNFMNVDTPNAFRPVVLRIR